MAIPGIHTVLDGLWECLAKRGFKARLVSIDHLADLRRELDERYLNGELDEAFYRTYLNHFDFIPPEDMPAAASILVVAMPRPQTRMGFVWRGQKRVLVLPPIYSGFCDVPREAGALLDQYLGPLGFQARPANLPLKPLAAHSGLAEYGRNNLIYVSGMGSFLQLGAFFTDLLVEEDVWGEMRVMALCSACRACLVKCPTGAIPEDRFLIHADRCLVYFNERAPDYPLPAWLNAAASNTLVGCMLCQQFCPVNHPFKGWFDGYVEFSEEETGWLLHGARLEELPETTRERLERVNLGDLIDVLPRNLRVFFPDP